MCVQKVFWRVLQVAGSDGLGGGWQVTTNQAYNQAYQVLFFSRFSGEKCLVLGNGTSKEH